ncbi:hypothetical protein Droror1_Dr00010451 [Drosera rotundifolia]
MLMSKSLLKCQIAVAAFSSNGVCRYASGLQIPGALDALYQYDGPLGAIFTIESISLYLSAPTAQNVCAFIYGDFFASEPLETVQFQEANGVWVATGLISWEGSYYVYEITVYHYSTLRIEKCIVNDPHARGLSADGRGTLLVNLNSDFLKPEDWDTWSNGRDHGGQANAERMLVKYKDHIQVGMAGDLRDFILTNSDGVQVKGSDITTFDGSLVAYAVNPIETVNYVSAHDKTLFDIVSLKTSMDITVDERCRINHLAMGVIALSQGVPFFSCQ